MANRTRKKFLTEEEQKRTMSPHEEALRKRLIALLKDDGKGHHHAKYAKRLGAFIVHIVPVDEDPDLTAAISFEEKTIYISEGFINPATFNQLSVILRHELAHNLLMHQIRMMHKIGEKPWSHIKYSQSLHDLLNIIEDFEISNKKYTAEDKTTIRHLWLNGKEIQGLITERMRDGWEKMSVEEMFDAMEDEIAKIKAGLRHTITNAYTYSDKDHDKDMLIPSYQKSAAIYSDTTSPSSLHMPLEKLINGTTLKYYFTEPEQEIIHNIYDSIVADPATQLAEADINLIISQIADSDFNKRFNVVNPTTGEVITTLFTPEEKELAITVLKNILMYVDEYHEWYGKVLGVLNNNKYSNVDIATIFDALNKDTAQTQN